MTYKQALYFIGKCLTLSQNLKRRTEVLNDIKSGDLTWSKIVKVSTGHMVLPALYLNLKRADLLKFLPADLRAYFGEITRLNRNRNLEILNQVKDINTILLSYDITPIFLKGTAHLLENLYQDMAERMVGDIDFIVAENQVEKAANILINEGYIPLNPFVDKGHRHSKHYPRLTHQEKIAAVEIHWAVVLQAHKTDLDYETIFKEKQCINNIFVPSYGHQIIHNILNVQINDKGFLYGKIMPRQLYDAFLLLHKPFVLELCQQYNYDFYLKELYLSLIQEVFKIKNLKLETSLLVRILLFRYILGIKYPKVNYFINYSIFVVTRFLSYPKTIITACYTKETRINLTQKLKTPSWYRHHIETYINPRF